MGFGANSRLHTSKILRLSEDLPLIIEIVDTEQQIQLLLPHLDIMVKEGLVTLENVQIIKYRAAVEA
jgi:PII-like signaling protein